MQDLYKYIGCFVNKQELEEKLSSIQRNKLDISILNPHVTIMYHPDYVDESLFGTTVKIWIVGYGYNDDNEGVKVNLITEEKSYAQDLLKGIEIPHITLSISNKGQAVNTRNISFWDIENPIYIEGVIGGYTYDDMVISDDI